MNDESSKFEAGRPAGDTVNFGEAYIREQIARIGIAMVASGVQRNMTPASADAMEATMALLADFFVNINRIADALDEIAEDAINRVAP